jgi:hypothetical protein
LPTPASETSVVILPAHARPSTTTAGGGSRTMSTARRNRGRTADGEAGSAAEASSVPGMRTGSIAQNTSTECVTKKSSSPTF